jgi:hypothetical protein
MLLLEGWQGTIPGAGTKSQETLRIRNVFLAVKSSLVELPPQLAPKCEKY